MMRDASRPIVASRAFVATRPTVRARPVRSGCRATIHASSSSSSTNDVTSIVRLKSALQKIDDERRKNDKRPTWIDVEGARARLPRDKRPWGFVHFIGGAVLGSYPEIAYDSFLGRVADDVGVVVVCTPFELGVDHDAVSKACARMFSKARVRLCETEGLSVETAPTFRVGHSLGCKLHALAACEDDASNDEVLDVDAESGRVAVSRSGASDATAGHFLIAFNNADATDSVRLIEKFARALLKKRAEEGGVGANADFLKNLPSLAAFAERAAKAAGLDFKPSPEETLDRVRHRFASRRTRLVKFKEDDLDQNAELVDALNERFKVYPGSVDKRELPFGNHLTPVYFSTEGLNLSPAFERLVGDFALGDEAGVERLSEEVSSWIRGV